MTIAVDLHGRLGRDFILEVAFAVPASGVTMLLGPSGSGKTTVLRAIAGLERLPGTVRFGEALWQDATHFLPSARRRIGYVFQGMGLLPHLTVRRNLDYAARRAGEGRFGRADVVARMGIGPLLDRMPASLSGGEAQRCAIARALLSQPHLLLMDEPLSGLDADARDALLGHIETLLGEIAIPVVYVTHDAGEAARIGARSVVMAGGRVVSVG